MAGAPNNVVRFAGRRGGAARSSAHFLLASDPRWGCNNVVELVSASFDANVLGVGGGPYVGDMAQTGVTVPIAVTASQANRYLIRLCGLQIPSGASIVIQGLRQMITLRSLFPTGLTPPGPSVYPIDLEQSSPLWHFSDATVSWHVRHYPNIFARVFDAAQPPGATPSLRGVDTALTYTPPLAPYVAPGGGVPPGQDVDFLGTIRDLRYPWHQTDWDLAVAVGGPGLVVFWASVHQTNPGTRPQIPAVADVGALRPEDRFTLATKAGSPSLETTIYGRIAGAMTVELFPCCQAPGELG